VKITTLANEQKSLKGQPPLLRLIFRFPSPR